ncbi:MAG TPA: hypothetical protein VMT55_06405, partial [Candidatus Sulfotelmatobacter sp.]|nr:hypothetical protein [Candidatus Sulfotelmatobacter sp.]
RKVKSQKSKVKIMVLPDHPTPIKYMTHTSDDVPFVIYTRVKGQGSRIKGFNEKEIKKSKLKIKPGCKLLAKLICDKIWP